MNQLQVFNFSGNDVRVIAKDGQPWWVAKDVCEVLEITNPTQAVNRLDEDERAMFNIGRQGETNIINEPGLYSLILGSRKPEAKAFKRWITHDVIPAIRDTGTYSMVNMSPELKAIIMHDQKIQAVEERIDLVEQKVDKQITLDSGQQRRLQQAIAKKVCTIEPDKAERGELFRQIHREIKDRWQVASYKDVLRYELQDVLNYVEAWKPIRRAS